MNLPTAEAASITYKRNSGWPAYFGNSIFQLDGMQYLISVSEHPLDYSQERPAKQFIDYLLDNL